MWFNPADINFKDKDIIKVPDLHGYVLPHAGTEFTGDIISHTLRFRPTKKINKIIIIYYPASDEPDIEEKGEKYYHEYYVPWKSLEAVFGTEGIVYKGYHAQQTPTSKLLSSYKGKQSGRAAAPLLVISADFSHFLSFQSAIDLENKAAHALMFNKGLENHTKAIDDGKSFGLLYNVIPSNWLLQWVGRTRSSGLKAVGYLSFLLREMPKKSSKVVADGIFVTAFSDRMTARECLGEWFAQNKNKKWSPLIETNLINKVLRLGKETSRLTGGTELDVPLTNYTVTYLYKDVNNKKYINKNFIRGWHGLMHNAFYLPEVFLENTFENGTWIKPNDKEWPQTTDDTFNLSETLDSLNIKAGFATGGTGTKTRKRLDGKKNNKTNKNNKRYNGGSNGISGSNDITLFTSKVAHYSITTS
jgi:hypothetical protein